MAWTDIFPHLSEEMLDDYEASVTPAEKQELTSYFAVREIHNAQPLKKHIVSTCLFWKDSHLANPDLPTPSKDRLLRAARYGLVKRVHPWYNYIEPLLLHTPSARNRHPDISFVLYLAADMEFLLPDLVSAGWEVRLMEHSSIRSSPGMLWRFMALAEEDSLITCIDSDRISDLDGEIARTQVMGESGLGCWRVPAYYNQDIHKGKVNYRPMLGGHFGAKGGIEIELLLKAFIWHSQKGSMPTQAEVPGCMPLPINATDWPDYGFDEWFLMTAIYPRLAFEGILTFMPTDAKSLIMPIDIEYATWANPDSEIVPFNVGGCC